MSEEPRRHRTLDLVKFPPELGPDGKPDLSPLAQHARTMAIQRGMQAIGGAVDWLRDDAALKQLHMERLDKEHRFDREAIRGKRDEMDGTLGRESGQIDLKDAREQWRVQTEVQVDVKHVKEQLARAEAQISEMKAEKLREANEREARAVKAADEARAAMASSQHEIVLEDRVAKRDQSIWRERWFLGLIGGLLLGGGSCAGAIISAKYGAPPPRHSAPQIESEAGHP